MFSDLRQYLESLVNTINVAVSRQFYIQEKRLEKGIYHRLHLSVHVTSRYDVNVNQNTVNVHNVPHFLILDS